MTGTLLAAIPFALLTGLDIPTTTGGWLALIGLGTLSTTLPIVFMLVGILAIGAPNAAILSTIEPIMTVILAAIFLGESLGVMQGIGGAFILASVILLNAPLRRKLTAAIET
jgi:drug/metabolite transporter (DMT)-like permease